MADAPKRTGRLTAAAGAKPGADGAPKSPVNPAVERVFEILEFFESQQRPLSLKEIVEWLGYPVSTTASILRSLVTMGYLRHDRSARVYMPSLSLAHLGTWSMSHSLPGERCMNALKALAEETGELIYLAHRNDLRMQYLHMEIGRKAGPPQQRPGATRLLVHTALGWALMSFLDRRSIASIIRRTNASLPPVDAIDAQTVIDAVAKCNERGFAVSQNTIRLGHGVIAAPLMYGHRHYSVGVAAPVERLHGYLEPYSAALLAMTKQLSQ